MTVENVDKIKKCDSGSDLLNPNIVIQETIEEESVKGSSKSCIRDKPKKLSRKNQNNSKLTKFKNRK